MEHATWVSAGFRRKPTPSASAFPNPPGRFPTSSVNLRKSLAELR
jgi:hypothetical protein